jgi:hypothetical protein
MTVQDVVDQKKSLFMQKFMTSYLLSPFAHGEFGSWDEILFLGLALVVLLTIFGSGWVGRKSKNEDVESYPEKSSSLDSGRR